MKISARVPRKQKPRRLVTEVTGAVYFFAFGVVDELSHGWLLTSLIPTATYLACTGYNDAMKIEACVRCGCAVHTGENINETGQRAVIAYTILRTTGVRPMTRAAARRRILCLPCAMSIGLGPNPNNGAFNEDIYEGCVELRQKNPDLLRLAGEQKDNPRIRPQLMPGSKPDETLAPKILQAPLAS